MAGSTEMQSFTLEDLARDEADLRAEEQAVEYERAETQALYDEKKGICGYCGKHIEHPAHATIAYVNLPGAAGYTAVLLHLSEALVGQVVLSGARFLAAARGRLVA